MNTSSFATRFVRCRFTRCRLARCSLDYPELRRAGSLDRDMSFYFGPSYASTVTPSPATAAYVSRIRGVAATEPHLLVAHMYTRYLGDLFGGQMMGGMASRSLGLDGGGIDFYDFPDITDNNAFIEAWYEKLNSLDLSDSEKQAIVDEGNLVFSLNIDVFNELEGGKRAVFKSLLRLVGRSVKSRFSRKKIEVS